MLRGVSGTVAGLVCGAMLWVCGVTPVKAQSASQATVPQASITAELQGLAAAAQTIFVGQIVAAQRRGGVMEVTFRVEQPVTGAAGAMFLMREWAGMWPPNVQRYAVGQRVLAFVHGASGAGLSSPVHGAEGLVPVVVQGANAPRLLDVRRVAASVVRAPGTRLPDTTDGAVALDQIVGLILSGNTALGGNAAQPVRLPIPVRGRPPVKFPGATRATQSGSGADLRAATDGSEIAGSSELMKVRP